MNNLDASKRQTVALAGVLQAAQLVHELAGRGLVDQHTFETSISSILVTNPESTEDIYGGDLFNLRPGARALRKILLKEKDVHPNIMRYAVGILVLQTKLMKDNAMLTALGERLDAIQAQAQHFSPTHENVLAALAGLYQDTLSTFSFRVQVQGDPQILQQQGNADKIRALLLAGVRSAMLWSQAGGKRWKLIFARKRLLRDLEELGFRA
ncbi:high frequency lysogenization protein HflD [Marinospirillum sp.]|uniref:high frequency lysogenization protein HflD n=1 Tax=Marinospirillum sp. TaxID=2183934 RepID=UPI00286FB68C|nr:high frequency lysogenization protein HflD [Marinospirillum sp.]MDR9468954.1 high frequency lysogenization protein HflD [Marinospirillum sp.]